MDAMVLAKPEVFIGDAASKFSPDGQCADAPTRAFVARQMNAFAAWIREVDAMSARTSITPEVQAPDF
jgi:chromate reductase